MISHCNCYSISGKHCIALSLTSFAKKEMFLSTKTPKSKRELMRSRVPNPSIKAIWHIFFRDDNAIISYPMWLTFRHRPNPERRRKYPGIYTSGQWHGLDIPVSEKIIHKTECSSLESEDIFVIILKVMRI